MATVGGGAAEFTGAVGVVVVGTGWKDSHLVPSLAITVLCLLSGTFALGPGVCLTMGLVLVGLVVAGFGVGAWALDPSFPSNSKYVSSSR